MLEGTLVFTLIAIERLTEIAKQYIPIKPVFISMIIGTILGAFSFPVLTSFSFFANQPTWVLILSGALLGFGCSLPANILHDLWQLVKDLNIKVPPDIEEIIKKIEDAKNTQNAQTGNKDN